MHPDLSRGKQAGVAQLETISYKANRTAVQLPKEIPRTLYAIVFIAHSVRMKTIVIVVAPRDSPRHKFDWNELDGVEKRLELTLVASLELCIHIPSAVLFEFSIGIENGWQIL
mmetsp:Transcript_24375/g.96032  ORF Transcript_24375/g.96032 Transcript_24375/m.96032 type:complete len:113 (-) Transcript_24375:4403-4741(-)